MTDAPNQVDAEQLAELGIALSKSHRISTALDCPHLFRGNAVSHKVRYANL